MRGLRAWLIRFGNLINKTRRERELADEIETNLQFHIEDNIRSGMTPKDARRSALIKFGSIDAAKEQVRDRRGIPFIESFVRDLSYSIRTLRKTPVLTSVAVVSLALGIGANTTVFTIADGMMLKGLPVKDADRVMYISEIDRTKRPGFGPATVSYRKRPVDTVLTQMRSK